MHKAISDQIIKYVLNSNENVRIEKIKNVFGLTDRQFNLIKFYIKKHRPNDFYNFLNKIDGTELEKSEYPMHIYVPTVCLNEKLEYGLFNTEKGNFIFLTCLENDLK